MKMILRLRQAKELALALGAVCTIERTEFTGDRMDEPRPKTSKARQDTLFGESQ